jgi:hypothetical protein
VSLSRAENATISTISEVNIHKGVVVEREVIYFYGKFNYSYDQRIGILLNKIHKSIVGICILENVISDIA